MLFSTNSFTTEAGRSTTSPAATWLARISESTRIFGIGPRSLGESPQSTSEEHGCPCANIRCLNIQAFPLHSTPHFLLYRSLEGFE